MITVVEDPGGDWVGLYVNDVLIFEGHSLSGVQLLDLLALPFECVEADEEWLADCGNLPTTLADVRRA